MKKCTHVLVALAMTLLTGCSGEKAEIICNVFELVTKVEDSTLVLSINTDLPDNALVVATVSRSYWEEGNSAEYSADYFSEKSTIGDWRAERRIAIEGETWKSALRAKQDEMSRLGLGCDVASVSNKITVRMVVPINQPDPKFGDRNANLTGNAVRTEGIRVVDDELEMDYPLDSPPVGKSPFPSLDPLDLDVGQSYVVSRRTPLMPSHSPADPMAAIQQIRQIQKGGGFTILETVTKEGDLWYGVAASDRRGSQIGRGWINSTALLGQELEAYE